MDEQEFYNKCNEAFLINNNFKCPRRRKVSPRCDKELYRKNCYNKLVRVKKTKNERHKKKRESEDQLYKELAHNVWKRDTGIIVDTDIKGWNIVGNDWYKYCRYYLSLDDTEKTEYLKLIKNIDSNLLYELTMAHRKSKGAYRKLKYDVDNVYLITMYAHRMIDDGRDPITQKFITKEEREKIWERIVGNE